MPVAAFTIGDGAIVLFLIIVAAIIVGKRL